MPPPRVTLRQLAEATGLHFTTVGLALRRDRRVNAETMRRVQEAAERLGYEPDPMLSALSAYRHGRGVYRASIGYLFPAAFRQMMDRNDGYRLAYEAGRTYAQEQGFKLEPFDAYAGGMSPTRLAQMLEARGIRGLVLAPLLEPADYVALPWERFSVVAIGYSVVQPALHRVSVHHARSMWMLLRELRARGYRRIGFSIHRGGDIRTDHNFLGAYLAEQQWHEVGVRLQPLLSESEVPSVAELERWLEAEQPDCVIGSMPETLTRLRRLGRRVPEQLGFAIMGVRPQAQGIAGTNENWEGVGRAAVDLVLALMKNREMGVPAFPRFALVEGHWVPGATVRAQPDSARNFVG